VGDPTEVLRCATASCVGKWRRSSLQQEVAVPLASPLHRDHENGCEEQKATVASVHVANLTTVLNYISLDFELDCSSSRGKRVLYLESNVFNMVLWRDKTPAQIMNVMVRVKKQGRQVDFSDRSKIEAHAAFCNKTEHSNCTLERILPLQHYVI
jgi:hypothetical protein